MWFGTVPWKHYSGNFWWARCDYISQLNSPFPDVMKRYKMLNRMNCEKWIGTKGVVRKMFNCFFAVNHYYISTPVEKYSNGTCLKNIPSGVKGIMSW